jgi:DNA-binding NarL/FixJ family response regulator
LKQEISMAPLRVLMVDDHPLVREGLRGILETYTNVEVVGEAGDGLEAVSLARDLQPDVVIMDVSLPKLNGIEATRRIKQSYPAMTVVGLSVQKADRVERAMKEAGAEAYIEKELTEQELHRAFKQVLGRGPASVSDVRSSMNGN